MPHDDDPFWDELGLSWRASIRDAEPVSARLKAYLKLQSALLTAGTLAAAAIGLLSLGLAGWALWVGWTSQTWNFISRGVTLGAVALLAIMVTLALHARSAVETRSLRDTLQLAIVRTERLLRATHLACYSLVILAAGGVVGYALRVRLGRPPSISPIEDLLAVSLAALGLVWFGWIQARALRRFRHVSRDFGSGDERE